MSDIFNEANMRRILEGYIPDKETLTAGIHALSKETNVKSVFGNCIYTEEGLVPSENGGILEVKKKKYSTYDIYLGLTQSSLVIAECETNQYLYEFNDRLDVRDADIKKITSGLRFADIGTCFPLTDIQRCEIKKGWMGSVKCSLTMKDGSCFKLLLPKLGGVGGGMPHHAQYREAIIARLSGGNG